MPDMSTQTWNASAHPRNLAGGMPGNKGAFITKQLGANDQVVLTAAHGGGNPWEDHTHAVKDTIEAIGVGDGDVYSYRGTALLVNPNGHPTAHVHLQDSRGQVEMEHNFATGITVLKRPNGISTTDPAAVNAAVRDIYGINRSSGDLFHRMGEEMSVASGVHDSLKQALIRDRRSRPDPEAHAEAVADAAFSANIRSGHAYDYVSAAMMVNPKGEPEAFINLNDGEPTQLRHNYATGVTTYLCPARGIKESADPDLIQVAAEDISPEHRGDPVSMFQSLRGRSLDQPALHPAVRASLDARR